MRAYLSLVLILVTCVLADLVDCLQLGHKGVIISRTPELRELFKMQSRRRGAHQVRRLEHLRNSLAHAQVLQPDHWETVLVLAEGVNQALPEIPQRITALLDQLRVEDHDA